MFKRHNSVKNHLTGTKTRRFSLTSSPPPSSSALPVSASSSPLPSAVSFCPLPLFSFWLPLPFFWPLQVSGNNYGMLLLCMRFSINLLYIYIFFFQYLNFHFLKSFKDKCSSMSICKLDSKLNALWSPNKAQTDKSPKSVIVYHKKYPVQINHNWFKSIITDSNQS